MKLLFLDDSSSREAWFVGYGGFCIDSEQLRELSDDLYALKKKFGIPAHVEIKWSPGPDHFLRARFKGRHDLYREVLGLLSKHNARVICAVHALKECYGVSLHGWTRAKATLWAAKQQLSYLAERFERPYLARAKSCGMIVCDQFSTREEDAQVADHSSVDLLFGTHYSKMDRIAHVALLTQSKHSPPIQIADVIVGVVTSALSKGKYGRALFEFVAPHFLWNPHEGAVSFSCTVSAGVIGYGLKVFPEKLSGAAKELFREFDSRYIVTAKGMMERRPAADILAVYP